MRSSTPPVRAVGALILLLAVAVIQLPLAGSSGSGSSGSGSDSTTSGSGKGGGGEIEPVFPGLELAASEERVRPGAIAQIKISVTEPKPIMTGGGRFAYSGFDSLDGIAVMSPDNDAFGAAVVRDGTLAVSVISEGGSFGMDPDYPVLTVAGHIPDITPMGRTFPFDGDAQSLQFADPAGVPYPILFAGGSITTARSISIDDVSPGSIDLPAGSVVTITGHGFTRNTRIRFNHCPLSAVRFIDSTRIDVVIGAAARMHGMRVRADDPDNTKSEYFSYQRTKRQGESLHPVLRDVVPLFPYRSAAASEVVLAGDEAGFAMQNLSPVAANAVVDLVAADGTLLSSVNVSLSTNKYIVREISEMFQVPYQASSVVRVRSDVPVEVMALSVDASGAVKPLAPR